MKRPNDAFLRDYECEGEPKPEAFNTYELYLWVRGHHTRDNAFLAELASLNTQHEQERMQFPNVPGNTPGDPCNDCGYSSQFRHDGTLVCIACDKVKP